jgi:hypothetical protein
MKKLFPLLLCLFLIQCSTGKISDLHQTYNQEDYLYWSETRRLTWDDFKGKPVGYSDDYSTESFMSIPSSIEKENPFSPPKLTSVCVFDKQHSRINKNITNDTLLIYYQTLFDIHEVYARKLRKTFLETDFGLNDFKEKFRSMTDNNNNDLLNRIEEFRRASKLGQNKEIVKQWAAKIRNELQELNLYRKDY